MKYEPTFTYSYTIYVGILSTHGSDIRNEEH